MLHKFKQQLSRFYSALATIIVITLLFILQFVMVEGNLEFFKRLGFWTTLAVMIMILLVINEIYWRNGSKRGEANSKYIASAIEYSLRVNRIKNCKPSKTEDFYKYIDEKNKELFATARNEYLNANGIQLEDYYKGHQIKNYKETGEEITSRSKPHNSLTKRELNQLTKLSTTGEIIPYYTKKQIKVILLANKGKFKHEVLNGTEILSGLKIKNNRYATSYNAKKNKTKFALSNVATLILVSILISMFGTELKENGWSIAALLTFLYRCLTVVWRAIVSDEAGYNDIVETKRAVNINRANITTMYATARGLDDLFNNINEEIALAKKQMLEPIIIKEEKKKHGGQTNNDDV